MKKIVSIHIPKCAGTSLRGALNKALGPKVKMDYGNRVMLEDLSAIRRRRRLKQRMLSDIGRLRGKTVIHGHFYAAKYLDAPFEKEWVTFVRHPVELVISCYHYLRRKERGPLADLAKELTLDEFVEHPYFGNVITRMTYPLEPGDFRFIGFQQCYGESIAGLSEVLGISLRELARNTNARGSGYPEMQDAGLVGKIRKFNMLDLEWYVRAREWAAASGLPNPVDSNS